MMSMLSNKVCTGSIETLAELQYFVMLASTTVSILVVSKANGFYARGSVIAFKIAPPSKGGGSYNFMHSKQYKFCKISDWICTVK